MARKKEAKAEVKVSKVPVELNEAPLVIDLPDGQKIILDKMQNGAVIEVATWHGTGRPDSRTNRFMIGMTNGDTSSTTKDAVSVANDSQKIGEAKVNVKKAAKKVDGFLGSAKTLISNLSLPLRNALNKTKELAPVDTTTELEINAWLDSITSEATKKAAPKSAEPKAKVAKKTPPKKRA